MNIQLVFATLACFLVGYAMAAPEEDLVKGLPGMSWTPNFKQYSGYLNGTGTKHLHYWFVESSSNPRTDPVVLWMNGGPGCSSMEGMLNEHGPFKIENDGVTISRNPFAWNQAANMIYLEAPAGVGYSYDDTGRYATDDDEVAKSNKQAMENFFVKFPEFKENEFYVSGESYGGIYIPTLVDEILKGSSINLKGFIVGNGLSDDKMNMNSILFFAYYHGLIGDTQWETLLDTCCGGNKTVDCDFAGGASRSEKCNRLVGEMQVLVWASGLNVYNLYAECAGGVANPLLHYNENKGKYVTNRFVLPYFGNKYLMGSDLLKNKLSNSVAASAPPCTDDFAIHKYMNTPAVKEALHISSKALEWELCSDTVGGQYKRLYDTMTPQYQRALAKKMRVTVYNGDVDMACNFLGDEWFVDSLHKEPKKPRSMWYFKAADKTKQVAGFIKQYDQIRFVTIRGAGHMVPQDKPRPALKMFISFLQGTPLE